MENTSRFTTTANKPKRNSAMLLFQLLFCNYSGSVSYEPNAVTYYSTTILVLSAMNLLLCNCSGPVSYGPNAVTHSSATILVLSAMNQMQ